MKSCFGNPTQRKFVWRALLTIPFSVVLAFLASEAAFVWHIKGIAAYGIAILPALPILAFLAAVFAYLAEEKDEFERNLFVQSLLAGIGGLLAGITIWANLEEFAHVPHLRLAWIYPMFWIFVGIAMPVVRARYR
jgi:hypothetical protein